MCSFGLQRLQKQCRHLGKKTIQKIDRKDFQGNSSFSALASCINSRYTGNVCNPAAAQSPRFKHSNGVVYTGQWRFRTTDLTTCFADRIVVTLVWSFFIKNNRRYLPNATTSITCPWPCICFRGSLQGQAFCDRLLSLKLIASLLSTIYDLEWWNCWDARPMCTCSYLGFLCLGVWIYLFFSCLSLGLFILNLKCLYIPWMFLFFFAILFIS